jgi:arylsulfatase A-like enzyme
MTHRQHRGTVAGPFAASATMRASQPATPRPRQPRHATVTRLHCLLVAAAALGAGAAAAAAPAADRHDVPNVVVLLADDLGYADVSFQGGKVPTPHIDRLAASGVRFSSGYVTAPFCSPTRAALMTGRYQNRFGHETNPASVRDAGTPPSEVMIPELLASRGYRSALVGKWHLGVLEQFHPLEQGFDTFFGFLHGAHTYFPARTRRSAILQDRAPAAPDGYLTDTLAERARDFIGAHRDAPFFLFLAFNAVHTPIEAPEQYLGRFAAITDPDARTYAAMTSAMDDAVGAVLAKLEETGLRQRTLVFFLSDNGAVLRYGSNTPLRGGKTSYFEGGIRVPFVASWPGTIPAGTTYDAPVSSLDVLPTVIAAAGGALPGDRAIDGVDLLPYVRGEASGVPHEALFWRLRATPGQGTTAKAVRRGRWKYVEQGGTRALYDLDADIGETTDLSARHPGVVTELQQAFASWDAGMAEPLWVLERESTTTAAQRARGLVR